MKKTKGYKLLNREGYLFDTVSATSFKKAREYFKQYYEGKFTISYPSDKFYYVTRSKNVIL